jgi:GNAT superfamily N-acetyltransferase
VVSIAISNFLRQFLGANHVGVLTSLVAAAKQDDDDLATLDEVDAITRTIIDAKFADAFSDRLHVAGIAEGKSANPNVDPRDRLLIAQPRKPSGKHSGLTDFDHGRNLMRSGRFVNYNTHELPILLLGRLGVDRRHNQGLGRALLRDAMLRAANVAGNAGVTAILVHALSDAAKQLYLSSGFVESPLQPMTLMMTLETMRAALAEGE